MSAESHLGSELPLKQGTARRIQVNEMYSTGSVSSILSNFRPRALGLASLRFRLVFSLFLAVAAVFPAFAQTKIKPGINLFSVEDDVNIGRQSALQVERQMPLLYDASVQRYLDRVGERLTAVVQGPDFPYQFKVIDVDQINAFALPGGFMYVNRGLIESVETEAELAGVLAHEMAHVALRHGTNQASKAYMTQFGLSILSGFLGGGGATANQIINSVGGFGLNAVFLKFSRKAETQADVLGAQMLARSGYDPMAMADFFETLRRQAGGDPSGLEAFFSNHPPPANRAERIRKEVALLGPIQETSPVGDLGRIQAALNGTQGFGNAGGSSVGSPSGGVPERPRLSRTRDGSSAGDTSGVANQARGTPSAVDSNRRPDGPSFGRPRQSRKAPSSLRFRSLQPENSRYRISYPENWQVFRDRRGTAVNIAPRGGVVSINGGRWLIAGAFADQFTPSDSVRISLRSSRSEAVLFQGSSFLERSTNELVENLLGARRYLVLQRNSLKATRVGGVPTLSASFSGVSPHTGKREVATLYIQKLNEKTVVYLLFVAPARQFSNFAPVFSRMLVNLEVERAPSFR